RRDRADRAALSVSGRGEGRGRRVLPQAGRGGVGAGGAPEHGPVAGDQAPLGGKAARGRPASLRRPLLAREPERGLPDRTPARAGPDRPRRDGLAPAAATVLDRALGDRRPVLSRLFQDRLAVPRWNSAP